MDVKTGATGARAESWTPELEQLIAKWQRRMTACQHAYYLEPERFRRWHFWLGIPAVVLSSVVGTAVIAWSKRTDSFAKASRLGVAAVGEP